MGEGGLVPTVFTHAIVPLAAGLAIGRHHIPNSVIVTGMALAVLPDLDVIGFARGISYAEQFGHRGASHSLLAAILIAGLLSVTLCRGARWLGFAFLAVATASHGLLDMLTNGGLGVALAWPYTPARFFWPETPIMVSPIGAGFFSDRGLAVIMSELQWIWLPTALVTGLLIAGRWMVQRRVSMDNAI